MINEHYFRAKEFERLAQERLKGLQSQERQIKELKRELAREKDFNDALVEANRAGRQSLIKFKQRVTLSQEQVMEAQGHIGELQQEIADLEKQLEEANQRYDRLREGGVMSKDSVKYLNEQCLVQASMRVNWALLYGAKHDDGVPEHIRHSLARMLGHEVMDHVDGVHKKEYPASGEREFRTEVYVLGSADMQRLYSMIRDEIRREFS